MPVSIQKLRVPASVSLPGREPIAGCFALAPRAEFRSGPETLLERLNTHDAVLPFIVPGDESTALLHRLAIEWVEIANDVEAARVCPPGALPARATRVVLRFQSGACLEGTAATPRRAAATLAGLDGPGDFFPLRTAGGIALVNRRRVIEVEIGRRAVPPSSNGSRRRRSA